MSMMPSSKKSPLGTGGRFDPEILLELLDKATTGLGEVARSVDEILKQLLDWIRSLDQSALVELIQKDISSDTLKGWHEVMTRAQTYEIRVHALRTQQLEADKSVPNFTEVQLQQLRSEVFASIPESVWAEAASGFGDPDLANL